MRGRGIRDALRLAAAGLSAGSGGVWLGSEPGHRGVVRVLAAHAVAEALAGVGVGTEIKACLHHL